MLSVKCLFIVVLFDFVYILFNPKFYNMVYKS